MPGGIFPKDMSIRSLFILSLFLSYTANLAAQQVTAPRIWSAKEIEDELGSTYEGMPVQKVYEYRDKGGMWNVVLCENHAAIKGKDTFNTRLKAIALLNDHGGYLSKWAIQDAVIEKEIPNTEQLPENQIWFWTKYSSFTDMDSDGYIDPLIVYGTAAEDRPHAVQRVKLILVYKGKKYAIRAVECELDYCRHLQYDPAYKTLPATLRRKVEAVMEQMRREQDLILHEG